MAYRTIDGASPREDAIAALTHSLANGEIPLVGASTTHFEFGFHKTGLATLLVTNQRIIVAKDKMFGKAKPAVSVDLSDLASTGCGPLYGVGPTWEVHFHTTRNEPAIMYFNGPAEAESFKNGLHDAAIASMNGGLIPEQAESPAAANGTSSARLQRLHDVIDGLRPIAGPDALGRPFGEGYGLEEAQQVVFSHLESPADTRECDGLVVVDLLVNTKDEQASRDVMAVMGATPEVTQQHQLPIEARKAVEGLGGAAHTFLTQFEGPGNMWDLWSERDDVALEFLCWHTVARLRMATAGRMPPVERP